MIDNISMMVTVNFSFANLVVNIFSDNMKSEIMVNCILLQGSHEVYYQIYPCLVDGVYILHQSSSPIPWGQMERWGCHGY